MRLRRGICTPYASPNTCSARRRRCRPGPGAALAVGAGQHPDAVAGGAGIELRHEVEAVRSHVPVGRVPMGHAVPMPGDRRPQARLLDEGHFVVGHEILAEDPYRRTLPWDRIHWFWGDERFVPWDDPALIAAYLQWLKTACSGRPKGAAGSSAEDIGCETPRRIAHDFPAVASSLGNLLDREAPANQGQD